MAVDESLIDEHEASRGKLQIKMESVATNMNQANELARALDRDIPLVESRVSSLVGALYSPDSAEDAEYLSRKLESICDDRERALRECEVIQGHMSEVAKSLKIIDSIEKDIYEKSKA